MLTSDGRRSRHQLGVNGDKYVSEQSDRLTAALTSLDQFLHRSGAPIAGALRAGLSDAELDQYETDLGFSFPEDVRVWFAWHDGADISYDDPRGYSYLPTRQFLLPLDAAMSFRDDFLKLNAVTKSLPEHRYDSRWLPITASDGGELALAVDCGSHPELAPVHSIDVRGTDDDWRNAATESLATVAELWIKLFDSRHWRWDAETGDWADTFAQLPAEWRTSPLL